jgi:hypothetical protein
MFRIGRDGSADEGATMTERTADLARELIESESRCASQEASALHPATARQLMSRFPHLRTPVIEGLAREGELVNIIASSKMGKSWLALNLALCLVTGRSWLGFATRRGKVLILDNELHCETLANRIPRVAAAIGLDVDDYADDLEIQTVRGQNVDLNTLNVFFSSTAPGTYCAIVFDALYRFWPRGSDENDNAAITIAYNHLDALAMKLRTVFVLIHHASKGSQSGKAVTDVGAGAGAQSRATDTHLILRPHEDPDVVVLDAAVRSWPPIKPRCLRWTFPVFAPADDLDPTRLRPERPRRPKREPITDIPPVVVYDAPRFVAEFITATPETREVVIDRAVKAGVGRAESGRLMRLAEADGLTHRWSYGVTRPRRFANVPQPTLIEDNP